MTTFGPDDFLRLATSQPLTPAALQDVLEALTTDTQPYVPVHA